MQQLTLLNKLLKVNIMIVGELFNIENSATTTMLVQWHEIEVD